MCAEQIMIIIIVFISIWTFVSHGRENHRNKSYTARDEYNRNAGVGVPNIICTILQCTSAKVSKVERLPDKTSCEIMTNKLSNPGRFNGYTVFGIVQVSDFRLVLCASHVEERPYGGNNIVINVLYSV